MFCHFLGYLIKHPFSWSWHRMVNSSRKAQGYQDGKNLCQRQGVKDPGKLAVFIECLFWQMLAFNTGFKDSWEEPGYRTI